MPFIFWFMLVLVIVAAYLIFTNDSKSPYDWDESPLKFTVSNTQFRKEYMNQFPPGGHKQSGEQGHTERSEYAR